MAKLSRAALFWTLVLCACAPIIPPREAVPQTAPPVTQPPPTISIATTESFPDSPALPIPKFSRTLETPHIDEPPDGFPTLLPTDPRPCGYRWAYQDLPELSRNFQAAIQTLQAEAQASAFGFGENCVYEDGTATFLPMETDFNVTLQVPDLADEADLGAWIVKVMQVIDGIPPGQIIGPRPGRVSILFESNGQRQGVNFYIDQFHNLETGLSSEEVYQALKALP